MISPTEINLDSLPWVPLKATNGFPEDPAIYFAIDSQGTVQYIGRSGNVRRRWKNHHRFDDLTAIGGVKISYLFIDSPELLPDIEAALIEWFDPPLNDVRKSFLVIKPETECDYVSRVAKLREEKNLTQRQVAAALDVDVSTIRNWERSRDGVKMFVRVAKLCELLECQPSDLFEEEDLSGEQAN